MVGAWASVGARMDLGSGEEAGPVLRIESPDVESVEELRDETGRWTNSGVRPPANSLHPQRTDKEHLRDQGLQHSSGTDDVRVLRRSTSRVTGCTGTRNIRR